MAGSKGLKNIVAADMAGSEFLAKVARGLRKPPGYVVERVWHELLSGAERYRAPLRERRISASDLARKAGCGSVELFWDALAARAAPVEFGQSIAGLDAIMPGATAAIIERASDGLSHRVDLLGSGPVQLGDRIDWHTDFKSRIRFEPAFCRDIAYNQLGLPSDVKVPWELSRMQWMIPLGQAYVLTGEDRYAEKIRDVVHDWIDQNPYAYSVNWACTMDVALRAIAWIWFFHACADSPAWADGGFRSKFLKALYLHGDFIERHLEKADINGNHYTADAAGLVFVGLFFGDAVSGARWARSGWDILRSEIVRQVFEDGVDFEASVPYHRLVQELFLYPALYRLRLGLDVDAAYRERLIAMAKFTEAYSREDGSVPLWGDADDARTLPFRHDAINDHRYLVGLAALTFNAPDLAKCFHGPRAEIAWALGQDLAGRLSGTRAAPPSSKAFDKGGFYVLRDSRNHVFIDCGPLGLAGRGGHGHNDLLAFEAMLDGTLLFTDCGAYLYSANYRERNNFRSTAYHNTPCIDGAEINRFVRPEYLWVLHNDATHKAGEFATNEGTSSFSGSHDGYGRLPDPVTVKRRFTLDHASNSLTLQHEFDGRGEHVVEIPFHLAPGVRFDHAGDKSIFLTAPDRRFLMTWTESDWVFAAGEARISSSYGVSRGAIRLSLASKGPLVPLHAEVVPWR